MKKNTRRVERLLDAFFEHSSHTSPLIRIEKEIRSTYDGDYPFFEVVYDALAHDREQYEKLTEDINRYTGLKEGKDYWIGVSWEYDSKIWNT